LAAVFAGACATLGITPLYTSIGAQTYDYRNLNFIASNKVIFKELTEGGGAFFPVP
jgi:hypothetical protein